MDDREGMVAYHIDAEKVSLDDMQQRIKAADLVPSRVSLQDEIGLKMKALKKQGIQTLADLRHELKSAQRRATLAKATGIEAQYLVLLRREIEGYFPEPVALKTLTWLAKDDIAKLAHHEVSDTATLYETATSAKKQAQLAQATGVDLATLHDLACLADLTRVQWVSPTTARMLIAAECDSAARLAKADAGALCEALERVNAKGKFFKGKIGLRDVRRIVQAASYV
jgi:hypothetical protein